VRIVTLKQNKFDFKPRFFGIGYARAKGKY